MIKNESSDSEINTINHNMKPEELKAFIIERSEKNREAFEERISEILRPKSESAKSRCLM